MLLVTEMIAANHEYMSMPLAELHGAEYNPRAIDEAAMEALKKSLLDFGFVQPVVARRDGLIVGGHQRVTAMREIAEARGQDPKKVTVPVVVIDDLDEEKTKVLNLALNKISGDWNYDKLTDLLEGLVVGLEPDDLIVSGFSATELDSFVVDPSEFELNDDDIDPDAILEQESRQFAFVVTSEDDAEVCDKALQLYDGNLVEMCREFLTTKAEDGHEDESN